MSADEYKNQGNQALKEHDFPKAVELYNKAIELNPDNAIYYSNLSQAEIKLEQYGSAIQHATKSVEIDPMYLKAYFRRANANFLLLNYKQALKDLKIILKYKPQDKSAKDMSVMVEKLIKRLNFEKAIQSVDEEDSLFTKSINFYKDDADYQGPKLSFKPIEGGNPDDFEIEGLDMNYIKQIIEWFKKDGKIPKKYMYALLVKINQLLSKEPAFKEISMDPTKESYVKGMEEFTVVGDVHGQFFDVISFFGKNGFVSETHGYLFNGDFVDRGSWSSEVIILLYLLKLMYPKTMHLNRGNHETNDMNKIYGFEDEMKYKYGETFFKMFARTFVQLPLITLLNNDYLIMHGGIFSKPDITIEHLKQNILKRNNPKEGLEMELLWTDPQEEEGYGASKRGIGVQFGPDITKQFCELNGLKGIIRSHEVRMGGYSSEHEGRCITVFSAPNYCDQTGNKGALINVRYSADRGSELDFMQFEAVEHPPIKPMAYTKSMF